MSVSELLLRGGSRGHAKFQVEFGGNEYPPTSSTKLNGNWEDSLPYVDGNALLFRKG